MKCVAIFGGAVAGCEAARLLTEEGIRVIIFEQNSVPYGKIEFGLPKWHVKLRDQNEKRIDEIINHPMVEFVPQSKLGVDFSLDDLSKNWGFDAVILAIGAWEDRKLPIKGIERFENKELIYQNPFVMWFNSHHDQDYNQSLYTVKDNTLVIGGGLASLDVIKIVMIEIFQQKIRKLGKEMDALTIEHLGLTKSAELLNLNYNDLGIEGATLVYRRRICDMPLSPLPENPSDEDQKKACRIRYKIIKLAQRKYKFKVRELLNPTGFIVDKKGNLQGLSFNPNKIINGQIITDQNERIVLKTSSVISSIGSIPEKLPGVMYNRDSIKLDKKVPGLIEGYNNVYAIGNAVTGKGNIKESRRHGRIVTEEIIKRIGQTPDAGGLNEVELSKIIERINARSGYSGEYEIWTKGHLPERVEKRLHSSEVIA